MKYILSDDNRCVLEDEKKFSKCLLTNDFRGTVLVNARQADKKDFNCIDDAMEYYREKNTETFVLHGEGYFLEPKINEYSVVYTEDESIDMNDEPYMWEYEYYFQTYWEGSRQKENIYTSAVKVKEIHSHNIADITYKVYEAEDGEYYGERDKRGHFVADTAKIDFNKKMGDSEIEEEIEIKIEKIGL